MVAAVEHNSLLKTPSSRIIFAPLSRCLWRGLKVHRALSGIFNLTLIIILLVGSKSRARLHQLCQYFEDFNVTTTVSRAHSSF